MMISAVVTNWKLARRLLLGCVLAVVFLFAGFSNTVCAATTPLFIAHFNGDFSDSSINNFAPSIIVGSPTIVGGKLGSGAFRGDGYSKIDYSNGINFGTSDFTFVAWFRTTSTQGVGEILTQSGLSGISDIDLRLFGGIAQFAVQSSGSGNNNILSNTNTLNDGNWHFLAGVRKTNQFISLYIDGVLNASAAAGAVNIGASYPLSIGGALYRIYMFQGDIDEAVIFPYALTPQDIVYLWNSGQGREVPREGLPQFVTIVSGSLRQFESDATTTIPEGGTTAEDTVILGATLQTTYSAPIKLQVELLPLARSFNTGDAPNIESGFVPPGPSVFFMVSTSSLSNGQYHWRARAMDNEGHSSDWQEFGLPDNVDFNVEVISRIAFSEQLDHSQFIGYDGSGAQKITLGTTLAISGVKMWLDTHPGNSCRGVSFLAVYADDNGAPGTLIATSSPISIYNCYWTPRDTEYEYVFPSPFTLHTGSYWLMPTNAGYNNTLIFGSADDAYPDGYWSANPSLDAYFRLILAMPVVSDLRQYRSDAASLIPENGTTTENTVVFGALLAGQPLNGLQLQVEVKPTNVSFANAPTSVSGFVANGSFATTSVSGLTPGDYRWQARTADTQGSFSDWQEFGYPGRTDFVVGPLTLPLEQLDHSQFIGYDGSGAQKITLGTTLAISGVKMWLDTHPGNSCRGVSFLAVYADDNGAPGTLIATSSPISIYNCYWTPRDTEYEYVFPSPFTLHTGSYWLMPTNAGYNNTLIFGSSSDVYDGGYWSGSMGVDAYFRLVTVQPAVRDINVAVILAEPSDTHFASNHDKNYFETQIIPQVKDYWCEVSFGIRDSQGNCSGGGINLNFDVFDGDGQRYQLSQTQGYYGQNFSQPITADFNSDGTTDLVGLKDRTPFFAWDAINSASSSIGNYSRYQAVIAIHPNDSEQDRWLIKCPNCLLTLHVPLSLPITGISDSSASNWIVVSENESAIAWTHELGHAIGNILTSNSLCDLYSPVDSPCSGNVASYFDVMGDPNSPWSIIRQPMSQLSSFSKLQLGWLEKTPVGYGTYEIESIETSKFGDGVTEFPLSDGSYYLIESRTGDSNYSLWDRKLPDSPLVIYKLSERDLQLSNGATTTGRFINVVKAVGILDLDFGIPDPLNLPYSDPANNVLIGAVEKISGLGSFRIRTQILLDNKVNYVGFLLKPNLSLLGKALSPYITPSELSGGGSVNVPLTPSDTFLLPRNCPIRTIFGQVIPIGCTIDLFGYEVYWGPGSGLFVGVIWVVLRSLLVILIFLLIILLLLYFVASRVRRHTSSLQKWNKIFLRVKRILVILIIIFSTILVIRIIINPTFSLDINNFSRNGKFSKSAFVYDLNGNSTSTLDIDLHAVTPDGKHVGMNYTTGKYENQIPDAIASGNLVYDDEWIFVPTDTQVKYYVSSHNTAQFLDENPNIAVQLATTTETYAVQAMFYDSQSNKFASEPTSNQLISPDQNVVFTTEGTSTPVVSQGVVDNEPPTITHTPLNSEYPLNSTQLTFTFSIDDGSGVGVATTTATLDSQPLTSGQNISFGVPGPHDIVITAADFLGNAASTTLTYNVVYGFGGFLPPIKPDGSGIYKQGRTLPVKFQLTDSDNQFISTATGHLFTAKIQDGIVGTEEVALSTSAADTGNQFRYDSQANQYIFNLDTSSLSVGTWQLKATLDDGKDYEVVISIKS